LVLDVNQDGKFDVSDVDQMIEIQQEITELNKSYEKHIEEDITNDVLDAR
jgi:hypothetical protein